MNKQSDQYAGLHELLRESDETNQSLSQKNQLLTEKKVRQKQLIAELRSENNRLTHEKSQLMEYCEQIQEQNEELKFNERQDKDIIQTLERKISEQSYKLRMNKVPANAILINNEPEKAQEHTSLYNPQSDTQKEFKETETKSQSSSDETVQHYIFELEKKNRQLQDKLVLLNKHVATLEDHNYDLSCQLHCLRTQQKERESLVQIYDDESKEIHQNADQSIFSASQHADFFPKDSPSPIRDLQLINSESLKDSQHSGNPRLNLPEKDTHTLKSQCNTSKHSWGLTQVHFNCTCSLFCFPSQMYNFQSCSDINQNLTMRIIYLHSTAVNLLAFLHLTVFFLMLVAYFKNWKLQVFFVDLFSAFNFFFLDHASTRNSYFLISQLSWQAVAFRHGEFSLKKNLVAFLLMSFLGKLKLSPKEGWSKYVYRALTILAAIQTTLVFSGVQKRVWGWTLEGLRVYYLKRKSYKSVSAYAVKRIVEICVDIEFSAGTSLFDYIKCFLQKFDTRLVKFVRAFNGARRRNDALRFIPTPRLTSDLTDFLCIVWISQLPITQQYFPFHEQNYGVVNYFTSMYLLYNLLGHRFGPKVRSQSFKRFQKDWLDVLTNPYEIRRVRQERQVRNLNPADIFDLFALLW